MGLLVVLRNSWCGRKPQFLHAGITNSIWRKTFRGVPQEFSRENKELRARLAEAISKLLDDISKHMDINKQKAEQTYGHQQNTKQNIKSN
jgi:hypothetical protein